MTLLRLKNQATPEYSNNCKALAVKMMQVGIGYTTDIVIGAAVAMVATILIKYGDGDGDVDTFADSVRKAIKDHPMVKKGAV